MINMKHAANLTVLNNANYPHVDNDGTSLKLFYISGCSYSSD